MTPEIIALFLIIFLMILVMVLELLPPDTLAVSVMVVLILGGFVSPAEGIAGLSNQATVTILALMILTVGLETTGVITSMGKWLKRFLIDREWKTLSIIMLFAGFFSAFVSTTAIVIVFTRILIKFSKNISSNLSRLLMPLSFAGILGGSCTLLGTSTNLIVDAIARENGLEPFGVFEFTHLGILFFLLGFAYMVLVGRKLISDRKNEQKDLTEEYDIQAFLTEAVVMEGSKLIDQKLSGTDFFADGEIDLLEIKKRGKSYFPDETTVFEAGDILLIKCSLSRLADLRRNNNLRLISSQSDKNEKRMNTSDMTLCEVFVKPNARLVGKSLNKVDIKREYDAIPLAVKKHTRYFQSGLDEIKIEAGDTLLMEIGRANFKRFYNLAEFVVLQEHDDLAVTSGKRYLAALILLAVVATAAMGVFSILESALAGCVVMILTGCLDLQRAYRRVEWNVYFLLAGMIPLGTAMENTGASQWLADLFTESLGATTPFLLVATLYAVTTLLSAVISNNATAILFAPIAISIAGKLNIDPRPLMFTIMFAANMSFMSPIGYQTNTLIYTVGNYRFTDFFKVGGILSLLIWLLVSFLIPQLYFS